MVGQTASSAIDEELQLLPLHRNPEYTQECIKILNEPWPRSETLRLRTFSGSCDELPTNLALVKINNDKNSQVVGHSRINVIPRIDRAVWIESVVISSELRGKGYGRILMEKTEDYARKLNFSWSYLSTHDQQHFYSKLGYDFCPPVTIFGGVANKSFLPKQFITQVLTPQKLKESNMMKSTPNTEETLVEKCTEMKINGSSSEVNGLNYFSNKSLDGRKSESFEPILPSGVITHLSQLHRPAGTASSSNALPNNHLSAEVDTKVTALPQKIPVPPPPPLPLQVAPPALAPPPPPPPPTTNKLPNTVNGLDSGVKMFMNKCLIKE